MLNWTCIIAISLPSPLHIMHTLKGNKGYLPEINFLSVFSFNGLNNYLLDSSMHNIYIIMEAYITCFFIKHKMKKIVFVSPKNALETLRKSITFLYFYSSALHFFIFILLGNELVGSTK